MAALTAEQWERLGRAASFWLTLPDPWGKIQRYDEMQRLLWPYQTDIPLGLDSINISSNQYTPRIAVGGDADLEALAGALRIWLALMRPTTEIEDMPARTVRVVSGGDVPIYLVLLDDGRVGVGEGRRRSWEVVWLDTLDSALRHIQRYYPPEPHDEGDGQTLARIEATLAGLGLTITDEAVGWGWAWQGGERGKAATKGRAIEAALKAAIPAPASTEHGD